METAVALDVGNFFTNVGFCGLEKTSPDHVFHTNKCEDGHDNDVNHSILPLITDKNINDWESFEHVIEHALRTKIEIKTSDHPLLLIEKPGLEREHRRKIVEFAFESIDVPAFYLASEPLMSLYSVGLTSGIVLSSGYLSSNVSTVHDGHRPPYGIVQLGFGGRELTEHSQDLHHKELGKEIDFEEAEQFKCSHGSFILKDKTCNPSCETHDRIGQEIAEYVLHPKGDCLGFHKAICRSIYLTDEEEDYEPVYFRNIMLCGGNTLFPGIKEKLEEEVKTPAYLDCGVRVIAPSFRRHAAWVGGSIAASLPTFTSYWINRADYDEYGDNILRRKCLAF